MKGRKPEIQALNGVLDTVPKAPAWLPRYAKTEWARVVPALVKALASRNTNYRTVSPRRKWSV